MSVRVHLLRPPDAPHLAYLRDQLRPDVQVTVDDLPPDGSDYDILVGGRPARQQIEASPSLRALIIPFAGLPPETRALMLQFPGVSVHNLHHNAVATAEMAVALMLAAAKALVPNDQALRRHDWRPRYRSNEGMLLTRKTALILGYGAVGGRVAKLCRGLGMYILATRRSVVKSSNGVIHPAGALPELLPRADVLIITLPLTEETRGLLGKQELALLPPSAILVNVGRAPVVDEIALYTALRDGGLRAAALDVWYAYPEDVPSRSDTPPSSFPFEDLDNVVMSPHRAGAGGSDKIERRRMTALAALLNAAASGDPLPNQVDVRAGY